MDIKQRITQKLATILSPEELAITTVFFDEWDDGCTKCNLWQFSQPGIHPTFLGIDLLDSLEMIDYYRDSMAEMRAITDRDPLRPSAYVFPFITEPFDGTNFYEWQIGPFVFQVRHKDSTCLMRPIHIGRFHVWWDSSWIHKTFR